MSNKIPTAEEILFQHLKEAGFTKEYIEMIYRINKDSAPALIEGIKKVAQLHVEAALKAAKAHVEEIMEGPTHMSGDILIIYPKENIL